MRPGTRIEARLPKSSFIPRAINPAAALTVAIAMMLSSTTCSARAPAHDGVPVTAAELAARWMIRLVTGSPKSSLAQDGKRADGVRANIAGGGAVEIVSRTLPGVFDAHE